MHNKNRLLSEVSRMIELSEYATGKSEIIKESINSKVLKEEDDDLFAGMDFGDDFDDGGDSGKSTSTEVPFLKKVSLLSRSISELQKVLLGISDEETVRPEDLYSKTIERPGPDYDNEPRFSRSRALYPSASISEFKDWISGKKANGRRLEIDNKGKRYVVTDRDAEDMYKWVSATRDKAYNEIGLVKSGRNDNNGKAQLRFLARVVSGNGLTDEDKKIIDILGADVAKNNAFRILKSYYNIVFDNIIFPLVGYAKTDDKIKDVKEGVDKALNALAGIGGTFEIPTVGKSSYNPDKDLTPWIVQIAKYYVANKTKSETERHPNLDKAKDFLQDELDETGQIVINSKYPSNKENVKTYKSITGADEVVDNTSKTYKWSYIYRGNNALERALKALSQVELKRGKAHPFYGGYVSPVQTREFYDSLRQAVSYMSPEREEQISDEYGAEDMDMTDTKGFEIELDQALDRAMETGIKEYMSSTKLSVPKKVYEKSAGKEIIKNFIKNFLLTDQLFRTTPTETIKDPETGEEISVYKPEKSIDGTKKGEKLIVPIGVTDADQKIVGNINSEFADKWIESQNEEVINKLKERNPSKSEDDIKKFMQSKGYYLEPSRFKQSIWHGLINHIVGLKKKVEENNKMINLIDYKINSSETTEKEKAALEIEKNKLMKDLKDLTLFIEAPKKLSKKGSELGLSDEELKMMEQKLRAKIQKILSESFMISEEEEGELDFEDIDDKIKIYSEKFSRLLKNGQNPEDFYGAIKDVISGKRVKWNYENSVDSGIHNFISSVVASLYNDLSSDKQNNIIQYVFLSFFPKQEESSLIRKLSSKLSGGDFYAKKDMAWDAVLESDSEGKLVLQKALEDFIPTLGAPFLSALVKYIYNAARNMLKGKTYSHSEKGERVFHSSEKSIDDPMGDDSDETFATSIRDTSDVDESAKEAALEKLNIIIDLARENNILSRTEIMFLEKAKSYGQDIMEEDGINPQLFSTRLSEDLGKEISLSNVNSTLSNIRKKMKEAKDKGMF